MSEEQKHVDRKAKHERASATKHTPTVDLDADTELSDAPSPEALADSPAGVNSRAVMRMQQAIGNRAVAQIVQRTQGAPVIQRHPAGAAVLPNKEDVTAQEIQPLPPSAEGGVGGFFKSVGKAIGSAFRAIGSLFSKKPAPTPTPTPPTTTTAPTPTTAPTTTAPPTPTPRPSSPYFMELARAQSLLQTQYGGGGARTIVPGNMIVLDDNAAILAKYDEVCIAANLTNPRTGVKWAVGDAQVTNPLGLNGFAWLGAVYINRMTTSPTTTIHEMLHLNTAGDFRAAVGETVNEGTTQYLTIKTLRAAAVTMPASLPYAQETALATSLAGVVTDATLTSAYFGGSATLISAFEAKQGVGTWAPFKLKADQKDYTAATALLAPTTPTVTPPTPTTGTGPTTTPPTGTGTGA